MSELEILAEAAKSGVDWITGGIFSLLFGYTGYQCIKGIYAREQGYSEKKEKVS